MSGSCAAMEQLLAAPPKAAPAGRGGCVPQAAGHQHLQTRRRLHDITHAAVGLLNGMVFSIVVAVITLFWYNDVSLGLVMAAAILVNLVAGAIAGALIPVALKKMSIDPALAGGAVLTTVTDVIGIIAFVGLATYILLGH